MKRGWVNANFANFFLKASGLGAQLFGSSNKIGKSQRGSIVLNLGVRNIKLQWHEDDAKRCIQHIKK
jgi:hypothetical protein